MRHSSVRTVANHQPGVVTDPAMVVAGSEVGEGAHTVTQVEVLLLPRHLHHHLQHGGQVVLSVLVPREPPVVLLTQTLVDMTSAVGVTLTHFDNDM